MSDIYNYYSQIIAEAGTPIIVFEIGVGRAEDTGRMVDVVLATRKPYKFFAFEPETKNIPAIKEKVGHRVTVVEMAVGDKTGTVSFIGSGSWPLSGSVKQPKNHLKSYPWIPWQPPVDVAMTTLDDFVQAQDLPHIDFIWADVQGAEDLLIAGGQSALKKTKYFYTEWYNTEEYEGQIPLNEIQRRLPGRWERVDAWPGDIAGSGNVLFGNLDFR